MNADVKQTETVSYIDAVTGEIGLPAPVGIMRKIVEVRKIVVPQIRMTGRYKGPNGNELTYYKRRDILGPLNPVLDEYGICVLTSITNYQSVNGVDHVDITLTISDIDTGESVIIQSHGAGQDANKNGETGKGVTKAVTTGTRIAYLELLRLIEDDESHHDTNERRETRRASPPPARQPAPAKAAPAPAPKRTAAPSRPVDPYTLRQIFRQYAESTDETPSGEDKIRMQKALSAIFKNDGKKIKAFLQALYDTSMISDLSKGAVSGFFRWSEYSDIYETMSVFAEQELHLLFEQLGIS